MKKIGLFTSVYFNNIGNGFIDIGAQATIEEALPEGYQLVKISQFQDFTKTMGQGMALRESVVLRTIWKYLMKYKAADLHDKFYSSLSSDRAKGLLDYIDVDALIIPGCVLTVPFFKIYGATLRAIREKGVKLIFLGVSGNYYTDYEKQYVMKSITELMPETMMYRDPIAYMYYRDITESSYNGIDNAFFVNRAFIPTNISKKDYVVLNFDHVKNQHYIKKLSAKYTSIVKTDNKPYPLKYVVKQQKKGFFLSDTPMDYLILLANAKEVHSDRVHSCIPTLSLGGKCRLYSDSKRIALFENVDLSKIKEEVTQISNLKQYQDQQIDHLRTILLKV